MSAVRPGDRATLTILAFEAELTALGLLRDASGNGGERRLTDRAFKLRPCGTAAAAARHRDHGEPLCIPCQEAELADRKARNAQADPAEAARRHQAALSRQRARRDRVKGAAA